MKIKQIVIEFIEPSSEYGNLYSVAAYDEKGILIRYANPFTKDGAIKFAEEVIGTEQQKYVKR